ncbi:MULTISPECIES: glycerol-3-phosphate 1-O-acyltransferase PlsY [Pseudomonadaceae]|jgi:glycerol-3-phosphate acyltransferase PlsY|uniref:Glycerol-3-phosphate acyltransferase n=2 Tax=Pseudomonas abyssi TaxID=170540 RepID=A0ACD6B3L9_9PSED|nr:MULTISPECIES: glycerol-3-phosphate 1-O-acyltransferase PlsY [Pseudomonadaceae]MAD00600.1 acyl-phosphate glycerol 3-phosphate acyltransferase [Pseudomonadales bacterium]MAG66354.1 acyl-phosphate glycerol 3-phosphate acyltransferase [Pseudomonadales bacterium]PBK04568.1 acyl-phosphate glycerol 3-phosphate acyltransferase [Pseudomonas abyssi]RGP54196.1 glycerol-3-phosphate acyltransferase [Halopseudomonas gallaeciensis]|tara:strand:- start:55460 stop:56044 length:585 start_codon:yes stop_codon:yes gene_type:complete
MHTHFLFWLIIAYLLGSVSFAVLISRVRHLPDPRKLGSGNPGASNMLRLGNRSLALATLAGDLGKGALAVALARYAELSSLQQGWVGLAAVCGHILPIFHRLQGGKGVATAAGVTLMLCWPAALIAATLWLLTFYWQRIASLASLLAALSLPPSLAWLAPSLLLPVTLMVLLILLRHRLNIGRLLAGVENRFRP